MEISKNGINMSNLRDIQVSEFEISLMKRDMTDFLFRHILKVRHFFDYQYRILLSYGLRIKSDVTTNVYEDDNEVTIELVIKASLSKEQIIELAKRRKARMLKLPKPHPIIRQREREMKEISEEIEKELIQLLEEIKKTEEKK